MGKVILLGAGCGERRLITKRGYELLKTADCVVYDRLLDLSLLSLVKDGCECIDVGKRNHQHKVKQADIEALLIEKAKQYALVIRLKGGDPYVFGRGGEEALALQQAGINFEVIPGISSAIAALSYAGIPITHRGVATGFRVYSAHTKENVMNQMDFASMAASEDTLVFLMGMTHAKVIIEQLLSHHKPKDTPIAFISHGARPKQKVLTSTLQAALHMELDIESPCCIVVGNVISLRSQLNFYEHLPLFQKTLLLPKLSKEYCGESLIDDGAIVLQPQLGELCECQNALAQYDLASYTHLVFMSKQAVVMFMKQILETKEDVRCLSSKKIICIGEKSSQAFYNYGIKADFVCQQSDSYHLAQVLKQEVHAQDTILVIKAKNNNHVLEQEMKSYQLDVCALYQTKARYEDIPCLTYDGVIFTSAYAVHAALAQMVKWPAYQDLKVFSIGRSTTAALKAYGMHCIYECQCADKEALYQLVREELCHV